MKENFPALTIAVIILVVLCGLAMVAMALPVIGSIVPLP